MTSSSSSGALEAVERILNRGGEQGDVLQQVVDTLHAHGAAWVGITFGEEGRFQIGPTAGGAKPEDYQRHPVDWNGQTIAELWTSNDADPALCARVAVIVSPYCRP
jgi:hypothetical protein